METTVSLQVYGRTWEGFKAVYQYSLPSDIATRAQADAIAAKAKSFAGDFSDIIDCRIVRVTHEYESRPGGLYRRIDTYRTLRGFRAGMTPRRFYRLINR
jgi:hypothetical protein